MADREFSKAGDTSRSVTLVFQGAPATHCEVGHTTF